MHQAVGVVARLDHFPALFVFLGMRLGVLDHLVDILVRQSARCLDTDLLFLPGGFVPGRDIDDAVGVDVEGNRDLRQAARRRRNADQIELAEQLVVGGHFTLALEDADGDRGLVVLGGREGLALLGRDRRVALDQAGEHAAQRLDAERQRRHVEQQHVLDVAGQHAALDRRADRHDLVRVDALMRVAAEDFLHRLVDFRHTGHTADQDHLVDIAGLEAGILERRLARLDRLLHQIVDQRLQFGAGQLDVQVLRSRLIGGDEGQIDLGLLRRGQLDLGLFRALLEALQGQLVAAQIDALLLLELVGQIIDDFLVEILAAQEGVAVGRFNLEHAVADFQNRDVERAAAKVVDRNRARGLLLKPVGERRGGRLVDDAQHLQPGDLAGVLGGLALGIVEISGHRDDRLADRSAEMAFGGFLHFLQDKGADLAR